jgi:polysaccharide pyruvyl transferase WcaK-like protein
LELAEILRQRGVPAEIIAPQWSLRRYVREFQKVRVFIGSRMHACIFSLLAETPTIGLAYQPKFFGLFSHLDLGEWVAPIDSWKPAWALECITKALKDEWSMHEDLRRRVDRAASLAAAGMERVLPFSLHTTPAPKQQARNQRPGSPTFPSSHQATTNSTG